MNDLSRPQLRLIIFYEWSCGTPAAETVTKIGKVFGETTVTDRTSGEKCFEDNDRCCRPTALNNDLLRDAVKEMPDVNMRELETLLGCSHQTISNHLHDLAYRRVLAKWVPHALFPYQMQACGTAWDESLVLYNNDPQRAVWIPRGEEPPVQPKANLHEKKCLLSFFWDANGMLYYELLPQRKTVNATTYSNELAFLALALRKKRQRCSAVHLLHDNARPHVAKATQAKLQELNWDTVPHPPYSPDIAPSDYHLFRPLKLFLKNKRFAKYEELKMAVLDFFDSQSAAFWKKGIDDFPERWLTVVTNDGQYIVD
uniref:HTH_48 domain-containing protein n=1 Tax=Caenorhabditis japonica TaxID=281687 RepID=A0A8R1DUV9_CAEJA